MIFLIDAENFFDKIHHLCMKKKTLQEVGMEETQINIIKAIYNKPIANMLNGEKLKIFPLKSGTRQECPLLPLLFDILVEVLAMAISEGKKVFKLEKK